MRSLALSPDDGIEGRPAPDDLDADAVHMHGFLVEDPSGREQAAREAAVELWMRSARVARHRFGADQTP
ncbi:hypothetical protein [Catenuloplanes japonicus]|uniref:hypothetical protein n=1 Tax=Catenuloplanes japonicus TaxID=33876 RepID=UPI0018DD7DFD|nr:hypothetical protein [Catenuloplanes japonicus]